MRKERRGKAKRKRRKSEEAAKESPLKLIALACQSRRLTLVHAHVRMRRVYTGAGVGWNVCTQRATSMQCPYELVHR